MTDQYTPNKTTEDDAAFLLHNTAVGHWHEDWRSYRVVVCEIARDKHLMSLLNTLAAKDIKGTLPY